MQLLVQCCSSLSLIVGNRVIVSHSEVHMHKKDLAPLFFLSLGFRGSYGTHAGSAHFFVVLAVHDL